MVIVIELSGRFPTYKLEITSRTPILIAVLVSYNRNSVGSVTA